MFKSLINWEFYTRVCLMENKFLCTCRFPLKHTGKRKTLSFFSNDRTYNNSCLPSVLYVCNHQFRTGLVMLHNIVLCVIVSPLVALRWSHFGTALAPGHMRQVNNLVFWNNGATSDAASSMIGHASDTTNAVAKMESNSNRISRDWPSLYQYST